MLELNDVALKAVSGGWGSSFKKTVTIEKKNYAKLNVKKIFLGEGSTLIINVEQSN